MICPSIDNCVTAFPSGEEYVFPLDVWERLAPGDSFARSAFLGVGGRWREGFLTGQFSNGEVLPLAQTALAGFPNLEGLVGVGRNNLIETRTSGQALIGEPESGSFGAIRSSSLEQSTVELASQFVRLIINQRAFQANTRTISATNELLANLVSLGQ